MLLPPSSLADNATKRKGFDGVEPKWGCAADERVRKLLKRQGLREQHRGRQACLGKRKRDGERRGNVVEAGVGKRSPVNNMLPNTVTQALPVNIKNLLLWRSAVKYFEHKMH